MGNGSYSSSTDINHGRPVFQRDTLFKGHKVLVYYWEEPNEPEFSGWWFSPTVGDELCWAYNPGDDSKLPPTTGWKVPHDGPTDPGLKVVKRPLPAKKGASNDSESDADSDDALAKAKGDED